MSIRESIRDSEEYQATTTKTENKTQTQAQTAGGATVADAMGSVLDVEKTDAMFWSEVLQVVLLYLILRELRGGR